MQGGGFVVLGYASLGKDHRLSNDRADRRDRLPQPPRAARVGGRGL